MSYLHTTPRAFKGNGANGTSQPQPFNPALRGLREDLAKAPVKSAPQPIPNPGKEPKQQELPFNPKLPQQPAPKRWSPVRARRVRRIVEATGRSETYGYMIDAVATGGEGEIIADLLGGKISVNRAAELVSGKRRNRRVEMLVREFRALPVDRQELLIQLAHS